MIEFSSLVSQRIRQSAGKFATRRSTAATQLAVSTFGHRNLLPYLAAGLVIALSLFSQTRLAATFLMFQSASLPLIWIGVILLETLLNWGVMRRLNNWALDAQIADPTSQRPQLRLGKGVGKTLEGT